PCLPSLRVARLGRSSCDGVLLDAVVNGVLQGTCHSPPNPRRLRQLVEYKGPLATRQHGGPAPCEHGHAHGLPVASWLAPGSRAGLLPSSALRTTRAVG